MKSSPKRCFCCSSYNYTVLASSLLENIKFSIFNLLVFLSAPQTARCLDYSLPPLHTIQVTLDKSVCHE